MGPDLEYSCLFKLVDPPGSISSEILTQSLIVLPRHGHGQIKMCRENSVYQLALVPACMY